MQEMRLIDAYALDKEVSGRCAYNFDVDIARALIANAPSVPAVPLEAHEKMKRELNTEIERLQKEIDRNYAIRKEVYGLIESIDKKLPICFSEIRAEAIKAFAERLKGLLALNVQVSNEGYYHITTDIDNLVKEMAGDAE